MVVKKRKKKKRKKALLSEPTVSLTALMTALNTAVWVWGLNSLRGQVAWVLGRAR